MYGDLDDDRKMTLYWRAEPRLTRVVSGVAIAMYIAINFVVCTYLWEDIPYWGREVLFIVCITAIMFVLYHVVGHVWGVYDVINNWGAHR